jgi:hypothetical protein
MLGEVPTPLCGGGRLALSLQPRCRPECRGDCPPASGTRPLVEPIRRRGVAGLGRSFLRPGFAHDSRAQGALVAFRRLRLALGPRSPASLDRAALAKGDDPMASQNRSGDAVVRGLATSAAGDRLS